ncbi:MAG TPA: hypothetical protein VLR94_09705 [Acidobacteriota bacterium]|nr:hypothetical protein [Acidobacteriota bacterium]
MKENTRTRRHEGYTKIFIVVLFLALPGLLQAIDEMTVYDLLQPESHQFAIRYDTTATITGSTVYYNIIRPGSEASDEKVLDRATGKELPFEPADGKQARKDGQADATTADDTKFIKVRLAHAVPENGEYRLRILKTYKDAKSYYLNGNDIVFDRSLGVKRNMVILPAGYELVSCTVPAMVDMLEGRVRISMVNDRDDELGVKIVGRKIPAQEEKK